MTASRDVVELYGQHGMTAFLNNADAAIFFGNNGDQSAIDYQTLRIGPLSPGEIATRPPLPGAFQGPPPPRPRPFVPLPYPDPIPYLPTPQPAAAAGLFDNQDARRQAEPWSAMFL